MHARVTIIEVDLDHVDEMKAIYQDSVVPAVRQQKGCQGIYLLIDRATRKGMSITLWDTEADMAAGETSGFYQQQVNKFQDVWEAPPVRETYEVSVQG
jgi:heme-degrading monooxygenase HmoA